MWRTERPTLFRKVYHDAEGKPTLAPYAQTLHEDSRLKPGESRKLTFKVLAKVKSAEVRFGMRLMPPPLAKKLKLSGGPLDGVRPVTRLEVTR